MSKLTEYVVRSGDSYVCKDNGEGLPLMICERTSIQPNGALRHTLQEAARRLEFMDRHGLHAVIELASKEDDEGESVTHTD